MKVTLLTVTPGMTADSRQPKPGPGSKNADPAAEIAVTWTLIEAAPPGTIEGETLTGQRRRRAGEPGREKPVGIRRVRILLQRPHGHVVARVNATSPSSFPIAVLAPALPGIARRDCRETMTRSAATAFASSRRVSLEALGGTRR